MATPKKIIAQDLELADEEIARLRKENKRQKDDNKLLIETNERLKERNRELFDENKELKNKCEHLTKIITYIMEREDICYIDDGEYWWQIVE